MRAVPSAGRCLGALSAAMLRKRSSACSLSVPEVSAGPRLMCAARKSSRRLRGSESESDSDESSGELAMGCGGREALVEWRERVGLFVCCGCGVWLDLAMLAPSLCECEEAAGETSPACKNCCGAKAKSAGCCVVRRAMSEFPRVTNVTGGPRELSMPWAL